MKEFLNQTFLNNSAKDYLIALAIIIAGIIVLNIVRVILLSRLKAWAEKSATTIDDFVYKALKKALIPLLYLFVLYSGLSYLHFSAGGHKAIRIIFIVLTAFFGLRIITSFSAFLLTGYIRRQGGAEERQKEFHGIIFIINVIIWCIGIVFVLNNLGYNVTAIVTGLGIGGIAIALAAQTILGDLFNYFVIFFDRPFKIGDFIIVDDKVGAVEKIGIKTTRIKSITGEQLVFANSDLTKSRLHNYKKMQRRRIVFTIGVTYQTPAEKLEKIPGYIKGIIDGFEGVTFDRSHFKSYGDFNLIYESVYFLETSDYVRYMDAQQGINLQLYKIFEEEKIEFAYPTQTLYINKEAKDKSEVISS